MRKFLLKLLVRCSVPLSLVLALFGTGGCSGGDGERQALARRYCAGAGGRGPDHIGEARAAAGRRGGNREVMR